MPLARSLTSVALVALSASACAATALAATALAAGPERAGWPVPVPVVTPGVVSTPGHQPGRAGAEPDTTRLANPSTGTRLAARGDAVVLASRGSDADTPDADTWHVDQTTEGVRVRNTATDRCLTGPATDVRPGARVGLRACDGAADQRWALRPSGDGGWTLAHGANRHLVLGVGYEGDRPATAVLAPAAPDPHPEHVWAADDH
ncbi:RICIN domain-containing protein [Saccharothrix longispora]|uniref:RICIN domain-containing protein n=1 Tax=Saccharothrix longispora TaxID=33920 RepID=UPI0028FD6C52|nr:RICIN domain-containing protein [Saccharothrix longispora]MDU0289387.1 RICIN domain-containing protein [Saccharothrix longispora]